MDKSNSINHPEIDTVCPNRQGLNWKKSILTLKTIINVRLDITLCNDDLHLSNLELQFMLTMWFSSHSLRY
jgi:hypothetical protein